MRFLYHTSEMEIQSCNLPCYHEIIWTCDVHVEESSNYCLRFNTVMSQNHPSVIAFMDRTLPEVSYTSCRSITNHIFHLEGICWLLLLNAYLIEWGIRLMENENSLPQRKDGILHYPQCCFSQLKDITPKIIRWLLTQEWNRSNLGETKWN